MKTLPPLFALLVALLFHSVSSATIYTDTVHRKKLSKIKLIRGGAVKGYITDITDSAVYIIPQQTWEKGITDRIDTIPVENIAFISNKKKERPNRLAGAGIGFAAGAIGGWALTQEEDDDDYEPFSKDRVQAGLVAGSVLGAGGLIYGFISRGKMQKFKIRGSAASLRVKRFEILSP